MVECSCVEKHARRRVVLTGGPGAGKTAVLEIVRRSFCVHAQVLPEAAGIVFGGGFPRTASLEVRRAAQCAIYQVQRQLERAFESEDAAITICDRGTLDGLAYWAGDGELLSSVGTTLDEELRRYATVIHLRTPDTSNGYNHDNPLRIESAIEAALIDARIELAWERHPRRFLVEASSDFVSKAAQVLALLRAEVPACCPTALQTAGDSAQ